MSNPIIRLDKERVLYTIKALRFFPVLYSLSASEMIEVLVI